MPSSFATATEQQNIKVVRQIIERGFNRGDLSVADEACAAHVEEHQYLMPPDITGPQSLKDDILLTRKTLLDLVVTIADIVATGDKVWSRCVARGVEARTGKAIVMDVFDIFRFEDGMLVEHWGVPDRFAMLHQVGLLAPVT